MLLQVTVDQKTTATRMMQACHHCLVVPEIAGEIDDDDARVLPMQFEGEIETVVRRPVIHDHQLDVVEIASAAFMARW